MLYISDYYKRAVNKDSVYWDIKCLVKETKTSASGVVLTSEDVQADSFRLSAQATSGSVFTIGGVCSKKVTISLTSSGVYKLKAANLLKRGVCFEINLFVATDDENQNKTDITVNIDGTENETGKCREGFFYIDKIKNSDYQCSLELYDSMLNFGVELSTQDQINVQQGRRTIVEWLEIFCESCSTPEIPITLAQGLSEHIANTEKVYTIDRDQTLGNYREAIGYLSILAGGFAVITRDGFLDIVQYKSEETESFGYRYLMSYEMTEITYLVSDIRTTIAGFEYTSKNPVISENAIDIYLNENPFLRGIQPEDGEALSEEVTNSIDQVADTIRGLEFTGGSFSVPQRPDIDLGDNLSFKKVYVSHAANTDGQVLEAEYKHFIVTGYEFSLSGYSDFKCNSYGDTSGSTASQLKSSFKSSVGKTDAVNSISYDVLVNDITLSEGETATLFNSLFLLNKDIGGMFTVTCTADILQAGNISFHIEYDNIEYFYTPKYTSSEGYETYSFSCYLEPAEVDMQHSLHISIKADTAALTIDAFDAQLIVNASGIAGKKDDWTGRFELKDSIKVPFTKQYVSIGNIADNVSIRA